MTATMDLVSAAELLEQSPNYRVLRMFAPCAAYAPAPTDPAELKLGVYVDVETTGLDTDTAEIIELAFVLFDFDRTGRVFNVGAGVSFYNDPERPIPPEIVEITGITDDDVRGQHINGEQVFALIRGAAIIVAHNADYDRRILEKPMPWLEDYHWACSYREVPWKQFGCACGKLEHIMMVACRQFYAAHRALDDCRAGVHALATAQLEDRTALSYLLESARQPTIRVWAARAPFQLKDELKARGYRWHDGARGRAKCWYLEVAGEDAVKLETEWLDMKGVKPDFTRLTARERYSSRCDL
jgi:DNA polymerase III subunit epsilon